MSERAPHQRPERMWFDLNDLSAHAHVSKRTLLEWIHRSVNPLPAVQVGTGKFLVRQDVFDEWLATYAVKPVNIDVMVIRALAGIKV